MSPPTTPPSPAHDWDNLATSLGYRDEYHMLYDLYVSNQLSVNQIGHKLGYSAGTISLRLKRNGLPARARGGANNTPRKLLALHYLDQRLIYSTSPFDIAHLLNCRHTTVWKYKTGKKYPPIKETP